MAQAYGEERNILEEQDPIYEDPVEALEDLNRSVPSGVLAELTGADQDNMEEYLEQEETVESSKEQIGNDYHTFYTMEEEDTEVSNLW